MTTPSRRQVFFAGEGDAWFQHNQQINIDQFDVIRQVRTCSRRLPGNVLVDLAGRPMMAFLAERLMLCRLVGCCILATTKLAQDDIHAGLRKSIGLLHHLL